MKPLCWFCVAALSLAAGPVASAQGEERKPVLRLDILRMGGYSQLATPSAPGETHFSVGFAMAPYLGHRRLRQRLSFPLGLEYVPVSSTRYIDPTLGLLVDRHVSILLLNSSLAFDVVQKSRVGLSVHYGAAGFRDHTSLSLETLFNGNETLCNVRGFASMCLSDWNYLGNGGVAFRFFPQGNRTLFFGADFTRFAGAKNHIVGTIGAAF